MGGIVVLPSIRNVHASRSFPHPPFQVIGNEIYDVSLQRFRAQGVSKSGLEYLYLDLDVYTEASIEFDIQLMKTWDINIVRFPLRDVSWRLPQYRKIVSYFVDALWSHGIISLLDLHTQGSSYGLDPFMKKEVSSSVFDARSFWANVSITFQNHSHVWFELFNEPHDISPEVWWYGNEQYYGYKTILEEIMDHHHNVSRIFVLGGLDYAYQWNFLLHEPQIRAELHSFANIALAVHPYGYKGRPVQNGTTTDPIPVRVVPVSKKDSSIGDCSTGYSIPTVPYSEYGWEESFGYLQSEFPLLFTEFGLDRPDTCLQGGWYMQALKNYLEEHTELGWIAWAWVRERLDYPSLLQENFLPTGKGRYAIEGPPCGVPSNQYYKGPGVMVFEFLQESASNSSSLSFRRSSLPSGSNPFSIDNAFLLAWFAFCFFFTLLMVIVYSPSYIQRHKFPHPHLEKDKRYPTRSSSLPRQSMLRSASEPSVTLFSASSVSTTISSLPMTHSFPFLSRTKK